MASFEGKPYCRRHYLQITRHGETFNTIYEENEWIDCGDYYECILKDKNSNEVARTKIDKEDYDKLKDFKLYARHQTDKWYALVSEKGTGKKYFVHRFLMGLKDSKYSINEVVDHINGDSLDNRKSNLRICTNKKILKMEEKLIELLEFPLLKTIMELINLNGLHEFVIITKLSIWDIITQLKKPYLLGLKKSKNFVVNTVQIKTCIMY